MKFFQEIKTNSSVLLSKNMLHFTRHAHTSATKNKSHLHWSFQNIPDFHQLQNVVQKVVIETVSLFMP